MRPALIRFLGRRRMNISKPSGTGIAKNVPGINKTGGRKGETNRCRFPRPGTTIRQRRDYNNRNGKVSVTGGAGHNLAERRDS